MATDSVVPYLFLVTVVLVLGFVIWQYFRTKRAERTGERSATAAAHHEPLSPTQAAARQRDPAGEPRRDTR